MVDPETLQLSYASVSDVEDALGCVDCRRSGRAGKRDIIRAYHRSGFIVEQKPGKPWFAAIGNVHVKKHGRHYYFFDEQNLQQYNSVATDLENPDVESHALDEVRFARRPLTLENLEDVEFWDLSLEYVVQSCLANSKILRRISVVGATKTTSVAVPSIDGEGTQLLNGLNGRFPSVYDPALKETQVGFGSDGTTSFFFLLICLHKREYLRFDGTSCPT